MQQREKRLRRQQRQAENLQILLSGPGLAFGRSKRERKQVDYSYGKRTSNHSNLKHFAVGIVLLLDILVR